MRDGRGHFRAIGVQFNGRSEGESGVQFPKRDDNNEAKFKNFCIECVRNVLKPTNLKHVLAPTDGDDTPSDQPDNDGVRRYSTKWGEQVPLPRKECKSGSFFRESNASLIHKSQHCPQLFATSDTDTETEPDTITDF